MKVGDRTVKYDFMDYVSFPTSLTAENDLGITADLNREGPLMGLPFPTRILYAVPVTSPCKIRFEVYAKTRGASGGQPAWMAVEGYDGKGGKVAGTWRGSSQTTLQTWSKLTGEVDMPLGVAYVGVELAAAGSGAKGVAATTWFDDLKIYRDGVLIFSNDFNNWNPYIGAGAGGAAGALAGYLITKNPLYALAGIPTALIGAAIGYYTAKP
jgi:hypothetical protein